VCCQVLEQARFSIRGDMLCVLSGAGAGEVQYPRWHVCVVRCSSRWGSVSMVTCCVCCQVLEQARFSIRGDMLYVLSGAGAGEVQYPWWHVVCVVRCWSRRGSVSVVTCCMCCQVLEQARFSIRGDMFPEVERTCLFVGELARYGREWRLHLPDTLNNILVTWPTLFLFFLIIFQYNWLWLASFCFFH